MCDCGIHPGRSGMDALPLFDAEDIHKIDAGGMRVPALRLVGAAAPGLAQPWAERAQPSSFVRPR